MRFLSEVHVRVREAAASAAIVDAYALADSLIAEDIGYAISRRLAVDTILAACIVYGAAVVLDPGDAAPAEAPAAPARMAAHDHPHAPALAEAS